MKKTALVLPLIRALLIPSVANAEFTRSYSSSDPNVNYTHFFLTVYSPDNNQTCKSTILLNFSVEWTDYPHFAGFPSPPAPVMKGLYSYTIDDNPAVTVTSNQSSTDQFDPRGFKFNPTFSYLLDVSNLTNGYHKIVITVDLTHTQSYAARYINTDTPIPFFIQNPTPTNSPIPEFPSWIILPLLIVGTLVGVIIKNKLKERFRMKKGVLTVSQNFLTKMGFNRSRFLDKNAFLFRYERCCWCL